MEGHLGNFLYGVEFPIEPDLLEVREAANFDEDVGLFLLELVGRRGGRHLMGVAYSLDLFQFLDVGLDYFHLLEEAFDFLLVLSICLLQSLHLSTLSLHLYPHVGQFLLKLADNFLPRYAFI